MLSFLAITCIALLSSTLLVTAFEDVPVNCTNPQTLWEKYICELEEGPPLQEQCQPRYIRSGNEKPKGLIVAFHGYTACPDSFESLIEAWVPEGYDVMVPLLVGQGRAAGDCSDEESLVFNDFTVCANQYRIDGLPLTRLGYIDFVDQMNAIVRQEKQMRKIRKVFVASLSQGGPVASYAVSSGKGLYDSNILMNSFFGFSSPHTDRDFDRCVEESLTFEKCIALLIAPFRANDDVGIAPEGFRGFVLSILRENLPEEYTYEGYAVANALIRKLMTDLAENFDLLSEGDRKETINNTTLSWGAQCEKENVNGRGGICAFRLRNLFAAHSFAMYAHRLTGSYRSARARTQFVSTARDGSTRNSLNVQVALNLLRTKTRRVSFCMHRTVPGCNQTGTGNECGVPHSMLSRSEQELAPPFELYWEDAIQGNTTRYFNERTRMGIQDDTFSNFTVREDCVQLYPRTVQAPSLVVPLFRGIWIRTEFDENVGTVDAVKQFIVARLFYVALGLQKGKVIPTDLTVVSGDAFCFDGMVQEFYLEFPSDQVSEEILDSFEAEITRVDYLAEVLDVKVLEVEVAGRRPFQPGDASETDEKSFGCQSEI